MLAVLKTSVWFVLFVIVLSAGCVSVPNENVSSVISIPDSSTAVNSATNITPQEDTTGILEEETDMVEADIHMANIDYSGAQIIVRVNDISIYRSSLDEDGGQVLTPADIRAIIKNGENIFTITATSIESKKNLAGAEINVVINALGSKNTELLNYSKSFPANSTEKTFTYTQKFMAKSGLNTFPWDASVTIQDNATTFKALTAAYQKIWDALNKKDKTSYLQLMQEKQALFEKYFRNAEYGKNAVLQDWTTLMASNNMEIQPLYLDGSKMAIYGGGKLARIETKYAEPSPLYFTGKKGTEMEGQDSLLTIYFYQPTPGVFVAVR